MKPSRSPAFELVLVSMGRYCQERVTQILNNFAAVGTFLLNCEETVSRWPGSCLSFSERLDGSAFVVRAQVNPAFSTASIPKRPTGVRVSQLQ
jgi:hypothetical protein